MARFKTGPRHGWKERVTVTRRRANYERGRQPTPNDRNCVKPFQDEARKERVLTERQPRLQTIYGDFFPKKQLANSESLEDKCRTHLQLFRAGNF
jgi:hypothetical protein